MYMRILLFFAMAGLLATNSGCRESECERVYKQSFWEDARGVKARMDSYTNILTIRVDESRGEDRGPNRLGVLHFKGTVVKSWKGDWKPSEKISFVHYVDYRVSSTTSNGSAGETLFVFANEHTNTEIALETGEFGYSTNVEQVLRCFFHK
jgi:hypothetical protein